MRKTFATFVIAIGSLLLTGLPVWAQEGGYNPPVTVSPEVVTQVGGEGAAQGGGGGGGALAFTGAEIGLLILAAALLAGIGALALIAARRRATRTARAS